MSVEVRHAELRAFTLHTRIPFRYGIATLTEVPHLVVRAVVSVDGREVEGQSAESLAPKWFTKDPATPVVDDQLQMLSVIEAAADGAVALGQAPDAFSLWLQLQDRHREWGRERRLPGLLWGLGVSLVERSVIDAVCRARQTPFGEALRDGTLGFRAAAVHPSLDGRTVADLLPAVSSRRIEVRQTVGLGDPIRDADLAEADRVDDGLPETLESSVRRYGLRRFKVKLAGDPAADLDRLAAVSSLVADIPELVVTVDGNEQYALDRLSELWGNAAGDPRTQDLLKRVRLVEQPFPRATALGDDAEAALASWSGPPVIVDESDGDVGDVPRARRIGYGGASYKSCKGVFRGVANACLLRSDQPPGAAAIVTAEDLTTVGVALLQDLAVIAALGLDDAERNGHHYFRGLAGFPVDFQRGVLEAHGDLYARGSGGFPTLRIVDGCIDISSAVDAPFGSMPMIPLDGLDPPFETIHSTSPTQ